MEKLEFKLDGEIAQTLIRADLQLGQLMSRVGDYTLNLCVDYFPSLVRAIIGQQLSVKVVQTLWQRVVDRCGNVTPEALLNLSDEAFVAIGLSKNKRSFILDLSQKVATGELDLETIALLPNDAIIQRLIPVHGIGVWTAEMFLIFSLGRMDVLSLKDLGLQRAMKWLYRLKDYPSEKTMRRYGRRWAPYQSVASLYLWEAINQGLIKEDPTRDFNEKSCLFRQPL